MSKALSKQELHNLAMNIVGKDLEKQGFEFIAVNSALKKHPQFVCVDHTNARFFVIVKAVPIQEDPMQYDVIWMESFKKHARSQNATVIYAGVGLGNVKDESKPVCLDDEYLLKYNGIQRLDVQLN